jgi:hypothetical protein
VGRSWYVDETYLKVHGRWCYLYRAIDRNGNLVDVLFSEHRDMAAAQAFFRSAKAVTGMHAGPGHDRWPRQLPAAIRTELGKGVRHRTSAYLNNRLEQDHRGIKGRYRPCGASNAPIGCPVLPGLRRTAQLPPPPLPPPSARSRQLPQTPVSPPQHDRAGHHGSRVTGHCRPFESTGYTCWREL